MGKLKNGFWLHIQISSKIQKTATSILRSFYSCPGVSLKKRKKHNRNQDVVLFPDASLVLAR